MQRRRQRERSRLRLRPWLGSSGLLHDPQFTDVAYRAPEGVSGSLDDQQGIDSVQEAGQLTILGSCSL